MLFPPVTFLLPRSKLSYFGRACMPRCPAMEQYPLHAVSRHICTGGGIGGQTNGVPISVGSCSSHTLLLPCCAYAKFCPVAHTQSSAMLRLFCFCHVAPFLLLPCAAHSASAVMRTLWFCPSALLRILCFCPVALRAPQKQG